MVFDAGLGGRGLVSWGEGKKEEEMASCSSLQLSDEDTISDDALLLGDEGEEMEDDTRGSGHSLASAAYREQDHHHGGLQRLRAAIKTAAELVPLRTGTKAYYERQNELITSYLDLAHRQTSTQEEHSARMVEEEERDGAHARLNKIAMYTSFAAGVPLVAMTIAAFVLSGSMALLATALDSILDQLSQLIMLGTIWFMGKTKENRMLFPAGNRRMEPLGLVVFSAIMMTTFFELCVSAVKDLIEGASVQFSVTIAVIVGLNISIKGALWILCTIVHKKTGSSTVEAFAQDHRNDVFVNSCAVFAMIVSGTAGPSFHWVDATAAICLSLWIIWSWAQTLFEVLYQLAGTSAPPELISAILFLAKGFPPAIQAVESVRAWHLSENFIVELDIVLPPQMPLEEAHQIGEDLQNLIEGLEDVERAFVHLDVNVDHPPEHR